MKAKFIKPRYGVWWPQPMAVLRRCVVRILCRLPTRTTSTSTCRGGRQCCSAADQHTSPAETAECLLTWPRVFCRVRLLQHSLYVYLCWSSGWAAARRREHARRRRPRCRSIMCWARAPLQLLQLAAGQHSLQLHKLDTCRCCTLSLSSYAHYQPDLVEM